jgi:hypothetical protein
VRAEAAAKLAEAEAAAAEAAEAAPRPRRSAIGQTALMRTRRTAQTRAMT